jgi:hypothetical protein
MAFDRQIGIKEFRLFKQDGLALDLAIISLLWLLAIVVVNPIGDFPLNDDWVYGLAVRQLVQDGVFHIPAWVTTTLVSQIIWGALFCIYQGFSFTALRFSTLLLGLLGLISFYLFLIVLGNKRGISFMLTLLLAVNPVYFALSYTFMTDVPFTAYAILATLFFAMSILYDSDLYLVIGACLSLIAIMCRQVGLYIPIAFGIALLVKNGFSSRNLVRACFPAALGFAGYIGLQTWLRVTGALPTLFNVKGNELIDVLRHPKTLIWHLARNTFVATLYLGFFLFPITVLVTKRVKATKKWLTGLIHVTILLFIVLSPVAMLLKGKIMPLSKNIIIKGGIGPETLRDTFILGLPNSTQLPMAFWVVVTVISILGGALLLYCLASVILDLFADTKHLREDKTKIVILFLLIGALVYFVVIAAHGFFDRYLLPLLPMVGAAIITLSGRPASPRRPVVTMAILGWFVALSVFSMAGTRDYLMWNRIRWEALHDLTNNGIPPSQIDGGYEFNGWRSYDPAYLPTPEKSWWWVQDDAYVVSFGAIEGYETLRSYPFTRWLPPQEESMLVLHRH